MSYLSVINMEQFIIDFEGGNIDRLIPLITDIAKEKLKENSIKVLMIDYRPLYGLFISY